MSVWRQEKETQKQAKRRKTTTKFGKEVKIEMSTQWRFHPLKKEQPNDFYLNHDSVHKFTTIWNMVPLDE